MENKDYYSNNFVVFKSKWTAEKYEFFYDEESFKFHYAGAKRSGSNWQKILDKSYADYEYAGFEEYTTPKIKITELNSVELVADDVPVSKWKRAAIGTVLFGAIGTAVGLASSLTAKKKKKISLVIFSDNFELSSLVIPCNGLEEAYRVISTLSNIESKIPGLKSSEKADSITQEIMEPIEKRMTSEGSTAFYSISSEILKLKDLLDKGIIDDEEFRAMKKKLTN